MQRAPKPEFDPAKADREGKPRARPPRTTVADRQGLPRGSVRAPVKTAAKEVQESRPDGAKRAISQNKKSATA